MTARGFLGVLLLFLISAMSVIAWRYLFPGDSLEALANHCAELGLPVHSVVLVPGSERETRFKFLIPVGNRARVADTNRWLFCHTNPRIDGVGRGQRRGERCWHSMGRGRGRRPIHGRAGARRLVSSR